MTKVEIGKYTPAIVLFIIFLFIFFTVWAIRYFGHDSSRVTRFPPWLAPCPDYWTHMQGKCYRIQGLDNGRDKCGPRKGEYNAEIGPPPNGQKMAYKAVSDPSADPTSGVDLSQYSWADKCKWAKSCDIFWEGVSDKDCGDRSAFNDWSS